MLVFRVQKPQVLHADIALVSASNQPMPVNLKERKVIPVNEAYVASIRFAKLLLRSPANGSRATSEISAPESVDLSSLSRMSIENRVTMPMPPTQAVEMRQSSNPRGRPSILFRIEAPVVVKPDTLSNKAFSRENSRPYKRKGSIPHKHAHNQATTTMQFPSRKLSGCRPLRTKMSG